MIIKFYNHACFSVEYKNHKIICDPYLYGTAFNDGWDLIIDNISLEIDYDKENYFYFSHEHPDHFSIPYLKSFTKDQASNINVIYQKTKDGRVKTFLQKIGFNVIELEDRKKFNLLNDFSIIVGQVPFYDSWACIDIDGFKIVNANDCILETPERVVDIKKVTNKCDVLFTQFSYANWVEGGSSNSEERNKLALEKLNRIKMQSEVLSPNFIVPFASMVRFCHEENNYMNDSVNSPEQAVEFIQKNTGSKPFLMTPYEEWDGRNDKDNNKAVNFWKSSYKKAKNRPLLKQKVSYEFDELNNSFIIMKKRVMKKNNFLLIKFLSILNIFPKLYMTCSDTNKFYEFSWHGGFKMTNNSLNNDLILTSESVKFLFDFDYGVDTLNVNARFHGSLSAKKKLIRCFSPLALNNTGRYISIFSLITFIFDINFIKQGLRTVGILK